MSTPTEFVLGSDTESEASYEMAEFPVPPCSANNTQNEGIAHESDKSGSLSFEDAFTGAVGDELNTSEGASSKSSIISKISAARHAYIGTGTSNTEATKKQWLNDVSQTTGDSDVESVISYEPEAETEGNGGDFIDLEFDAGIQSICDKVHAETAAIFEILGRIQPNNTKLNNTTTKNGMVLSEEACQCLRNHARAIALLFGDDVVGLQQPVTLKYDEGYTEYLQHSAERSALATRANQAIGKAEREKAAKNKDIRRQHRKETGETHSEKNSLRWQDQKERASLNRDLGDAVKEAEENLQDRDHFRSQNIGLRKEISTLKAKLDRALRRDEQVCQAFLREEIQLKERLREQSTEIDTLRGNNKRLVKELDSMVMVKTFLTVENGCLMKELILSKQEKDVLQQTLNNTIEHVEHRKAQEIESKVALEQLQRIEAANRGLEKECAAIRGTLAEARAQRDRSIIDTKCSRDALAQKQDELETLSKERRYLDKDNWVLRHALVDTFTRLENLGKKLKDAQEEIEKLKQTKQKTPEIDPFYKALAKANSDGDRFSWCQTFIVEVARLRTELAATKSQLSTAESHSAVHQTEKEDFKKSMFSAREEAKNVKEQLEQANVALERAHERATANQKLHREAVTTGFTIQGQLRREVSVCQRVRSKSHDLLKEIRVLTREVEIAKQKLEQNQADDNATQRNCIILAQQKAEMKARAARAEKLLAEEKEMNRKLRGEMSFKRNQSAEDI